MALLFDASTDKVSFGDVATFDGLTALTIACWAKLDSISNTTIGRRWVSKWDGGAGLASCSFVMGHMDAVGGNMAIGISDGSAFPTGFAISTSTGQVLFADTTWRHYAWTWATPNSLALYLNGASRATWRV